MLSLNMRAKARTRTGRTGPDRRGRLADPPGPRDDGRGSQEQVIEREEVVEIMWALADLRADATWLRALFEEEADDDHEAE